MPPATRRRTRQTTSKQRNPEEDASVYLGDRTTSAKSVATSEISQRQFENTRVAFDDMRSQSLAAQPAALLVLSHQPSGRVIGDVGPDGFPKCLERIFPSPEIVGKHRRELCARKWFAGYQFDSLAQKSFGFIRLSGVDGVARLQRREELHSSRTERADAEPALPRTGNRSGCRDGLPPYRDPRVRSAARQA